VRLRAQNLCSKADKGKPGLARSERAARTVDSAQVLSDSAKTLPKKRHCVLLFAFATLVKTAQRDSRDNVRAGWISR
jgi:hypothetical protein